MGHACNNFLTVFGALSLESTFTLSAWYFPATFWSSQSNSRTDTPVQTWKFWGSERVTPEPSGQYAVVNSVGGLQSSHYGLAHFHTLPHLILRTVLWNMDYEPSKVRNPTQDVADLNLLRITGSPRCPTRLYSKMWSKGTFPLKQDSYGI